jgi:hypothetical protein
MVCNNFFQIYTFKLFRLCNRDQCMLQFMIGGTSHLKCPIKKKNGHIKSTYRLIAHPQLLVHATTEGFLPARTTFRVGLTNESH